jgi:hypothetical protein
MLSLDKSLLRNTNYQISRFKFIYILRYFFLIILIFSPFFLIKVNKNFKIINYKISKNLFLLSLYFFTIFNILMFMIVGFDWGRWISIGYILLTFSIFYFIKTSFISVTNGINNKLNYFFYIVLYGT